LTCCSSLDYKLTRYIVNPKNGKAAGMISKATYDVVQANAQALDSAIIYDRDFNYNL
jgi:ribonucleoside-diphosphate reductase subunit M1